MERWRRWSWWGVAALLGCQVGLLAWSATRHSPTIDEVGHLVAGLSHWQLGRFDLYRVNPPLVRMVQTLPVQVQGVRPDWSRLLREGYSRQLEFPLGDQLTRDLGPEVLSLYVWARWGGVVFSVLGGWLCYWWGRQLYGEAAGWLALGLWCFDPLVLGHGSLVTPDVGATALGLLSGYCFWWWLRGGGYGRAVAAGLTLGLAELAKATWLLLFVLWPVLWGYWRWVQRRKETPVPTFGQLLLVLALGLWVLNLGYGYEGTLEPLGNYDFVSDWLRGPAGEYPRSRNRFTGSWLGELPVPLPRHYVLGIDEQKHDFEKKIWSYLCGEWRLGGWWYYYLYGLGVKMPLGTLGIWLLAALSVWMGNRSRERWPEEIVVLAPAVAVVALVSSQTGFNHHLRYVLPALPFLWVVGSRVVSPWGLPGRWGKLLVWGLAGWSVGSSLWYYPHSLSYFNEWAGGPENGSAYLVDSNIDWGQDLLYLRSWVAAHPEARPLHLAYFGRFDPRVLGLEFVLPPKSPVAGVAKDWKGAALPGPQPGWHAVSVTILRGYKYTIPDGQGGLDYTDQPYYSYFLRCRPVARAGYSIYIYHLDLAEANRLRREMGLPLLAEPAKP